MTCQIIATCSRFLAILSSITILFSFVLADNSCSVLCDCDIWYDLKRASCVSKRIYSIHTGTPSSIQALDLSDNSISSLGNNELAEAGLTNLKYLNLSQNAISDISLEAFSRINELKVLDLSRNHLYHLLPDIFIETKNLRVLKLSKNNFNMHLPKLQCPWLTELDVSSCQISHISSDTFTGLTHLRSLDLTNNLMIQLDKVVLGPLQFLRKISLKGNPWSCNGIIYDMKNNLLSRQVEYDTICNKTSQGTKKFEKMILKPLMDSKVRKNSLKDYTKLEENNFKYNKVILNSTSTNTTTKDLKIIYETYSSMTLYWFLIMGFLFGCATGMLVCYLYSLRKSIYCCSNDNYHPHRTYSDDLQRLFLLRNQWHVAATGPTLNSSQTISSPGTPPPPYRDVMLRPGLYRAATPI